MIADCSEQTCQSSIHNPQSKLFQLTRAAQETIERTFRSFEIYLVAAAIYFCLSYPWSRLAEQAEARLQRH